MTASLRWMSAVFSIELRKAFAYRIDFWVSVVASAAAEMAVAYFLWKAVFEHRQVAELGGYTFGAMMLYTLLVNVAAKVLQGPDYGFMSTDIYEGALTRYLVYPVSFYSYKLTAYFAKSSVAIFQLCVILYAYLLIFGRPTEVQLSASSFLMGVVAISVSTCLYFAIASILEMVSFWADNVWSLNVMLRFSCALFGGGLLPLTLFPEKAQAVLAWMPFNYLMSFPVNVMMGKVGLVAWAQGLLMTGAWICLFLGIGRIVWQRGTRQYTGVGA